MADYNPTGLTRAERARILGSTVIVEGTEYYKGSGSNPISTTFEQDVRDTFIELGDLLIKKHKDYGPKNISNSPYGVIRGLITRMWDKMARMVNLTKGDNITAENEPLEDSFKDMANYSVIAIMELRGQWPKE